MGHWWECVYVYMKKQNKKIKVTALRKEGRGTTRQQQQQPKLKRSTCVFYTRKFCLCGVLRCCSLVAERPRGGEAATIIMKAHHQTRLPCLDKWQIHWHETPIRTNATSTSSLTLLPSTHHTKQTGPQQIARAPGIITWATTDTGHTYALATLPD